MSAAKLLKVTNPPDVMRRMLAFLRPHRKTFTLALCSMVIYGATDGVVPLLIRRVLDDIFGHQNRLMLYVLPGVIILFAIFRGLFGFFQNYLSSKVGLRVVRDLRNEVGTHLLSLSPSFFERHTTGSLISRVTNDVLLVRFALTDAVAAVLRDSIRIIALLCAALYLDPVLAIIAFVGFPLGLYPVIRFGKKVRKLSRTGQEQFGGLAAILQENLIGHKVVQSFSNEDYEIARMKGENERLTKTILKAEKYGSLSAPTNEILASFAIGGVILYGGMSVIGGVRTQGDFIAFIMSMFLLYEPLKKLGRVNSIFQSGAGAAERIFEVLDAKPEVADLPGAPLLPAENPKIEFKNVFFAYETGDEARWVLRDVNLIVPPGETLALVGMSGGGKSTLVNLLPRFYDPQRGMVCIGGTNIRDVNLASLRKAIAIVSQHTFLFNDTVYHNILYGNLNASDEEVFAAARAANANDFIQKLPEGYATVVGEQGLRLSGGERARLAIARALLKDAPILILDEATASLDSESESLVQDAIDRLMEERTVLVIAHRLATIRKANRIAVIVNGQIVEYGTHDELLSKGGEYAKLYRIQFAGEEVESKVSVCQGAD